MSIVFARTRWEYASYLDFWKVCWLSGFPVVYVDEIDPQSDNIYVITPLNGEWHEGWQNPKARIILWDLEWRSAKPNIRGISEVWTSDEWYAERMGAKYVILGSHPSLCAGDLTRTEKQYDITMFAYMVYRRGVIESKCIEEGLKVAPNYGAEDSRRHDVLLQSRLCLHVHQHEDIHTISPTRWQTAAAYHLPILSEIVDKPSIFEHVCLWAGYGKLPVMAKLATSGQYCGRLQEFADRFHDKLCVEYTFRRCVENAL